MNQIPNSFHHWLRTFTAIVIFQVIPVSAKNQHSSLNWKYLLPQELNSEISRPQINLNYSDEDTSRSDWASSLYGNPCEWVTYKSSPSFVPGGNGSVSGGSERTRVCDRRGRVGTAGRIINGDDAAHKNHPWVVYIEVCLPNSKDCSMCGGTILSKKTILTARHCVMKPCNGRIIYGDISKHKGREIEFSCSSQLVVKHDRFDIAIIKVKKGRQFHPKFPVVSIPRSEEEHPVNGQKVTVVGWGRACNKKGQCHKQDERPDIMQEVEIEVKEDCPFSAKKNVFCAGGVGQDGLPRDACQGDSGGPLECLDKSEDVYQCGVVSTGPIPPECGRKPGGYVKLAHEEVIKWLIDKGGAQNKLRHRLGDTSERSYVNGDWRICSHLGPILFAVLLAVLF